MSLPDGTQFTWTGEKNRPLLLMRPCECGCDCRGGWKGVGYITASNEKGEGFTIWIQKEEVFNALKEVIKR